ncbi:DUF397 domain-containing protein [Streptomyces sp. NPDC051664]|uniref:DUF397 domain-containing protein n=1 Tax=Streptomyces sp. NPDC051664 TaxID=3365668 RepID=UPI0037A23CC3
MKDLRRTPPVRLLCIHELTSPPKYASSTRHPIQGRPVGARVGEACRTSPTERPVQRHSDDQRDNCVEITRCPHTIRVRDSKDLAVPVLALSPTAWADFLPYAARQ